MKSYLKVTALLGVVWMTCNLSQAQFHDLAEEGDMFGTAIATGDFNGDGYTDLAVGALEEDVDGVVAAGAVNVAYGSADGLTIQHTSFWTQNVKGVPNDPESYEWFGKSLVAADFDQDGYDDLAIGVPSEEFNDIQEVGGVHLLMGSSDGLDHEIYLHQNVEDVPDEEASGELFGYSLATGDVNGDTYPDLIVGVPGEDVGDIVGAGAVHVFFGTANGLNLASSQFWHQDSADVPGEAEDGDSFGFAVAAGDINDDGFDDLLIGIPEEDEGTAHDNGAVQVLFGGIAGITAVGSQYIHQETAGIGGENEDYDHFGHALTIGDYNNDGKADAAIGAPFETFNGVGAAGGVTIIYGASSGLDENTAHFMNQDVTGIIGEHKEGDSFGYSLATLDYDGNGVDDIMVGMPGKEVNGLDEAGSVQLIMGSSQGLESATNEQWTQESQLNGVNSEAYDYFGATVAWADLNGDNASELLIGAPRKSFAGISEAGAVFIRDGDSGIFSRFNQNVVPTEPFVYGPTEELPILIGGNEDPVAPDTPFTVTWGQANDPDNNVLTYTWQLSFTTTFDLNPIDEEVGSDTTYSVPFAQLGDILKAVGTDPGGSQTFYHRVNVSDGIVTTYGTLRQLTLIRGAIVSTEDGFLPAAFELGQSYPNPTRGKTTIDYALPDAGEVVLEVFDVRGARIQEIRKGVQPAGRHQIELDLEEVSAGVYFYRLRGGSETDTKQLIVVR